MHIHSLRPTASTPLVELRNIHLHVGQKIILQNIQLRLYPDHVTTIVGPNGGGKSSLLKVLLKLIAPTRGEVIYHGDVRIGYVPQKIHVDPSFPITVEKFLRLKKGISSADIHHALHLLAISHLANSSLQKLSGGEMQRVLLARAILTKPNLLVLDEPTQGVDINGQVELYQLIHTMRKQLRCAVLMVSHDLHLVMADTHDVLCVNQHICCAGTPESVSHDPEFIHFFGDQFAKNITVYTHNHNHRHDMHGDVCCTPHSHTANCTHQPQ